LFLPLFCPVCSLQVPVSEVESWVVQAIAEGLIDAKMDQPAATVTVTRAMQREFGTAQWGSLQAKLRAWRDSVSGLLAMVEGTAAATTAGGSGPAEKK
jgi:translation initiation factor 3 subunit M